MKDIEKFHNDLGEIILENKMLKDEVKRLKHALLHILLHKKNRGRITGMMVMGRAYVDWDSISVKFEMRKCALIHKVNREVISTWDMVPRKPEHEKEKPSI